LIFPSNYGLTASSTIACSANYGFELFGGCSVDSDGKTISVTNIKSVDFLLILQIDNIKTPSYVNLWSVLIYSYDNNGVLIPGERSGSSMFGFSTTPGDLSCTLNNLGSDIVADYTDVSVQCIVANEVELTGSFILGLPKWNAGTPEIGLERSMIKYDVL